MGTQSPFFPQKDKPRTLAWDKMLGLLPSSFRLFQPRGSPAFPAHSPDNLPSPAENKDAMSLAPCKTALAGVREIIHLPCLPALCLVVELTLKPHPYSLQTDFLPSLSAACSTNSKSPIRRPHPLVKLVPSCHLWMFPVISGKDGSSHLETSKGTEPVDSGGGDM